MEVIRNHNSSNEDEPLFLYVAFQAAHSPILKPPQKYLDLYKNIKISKHLLHRAGTVSVSIVNYTFMYMRILLEGHG